MAPSILTSITRNKSKGPKEADEQRTSDRNRQSRTQACFQSKTQAPRRSGGQQLGRRSVGWLHRQRPGTAEGPQIKGRVRWDAYEKSVGKYSCDSEFVGVIETEDGAEIKFESKGFTRVLDRSKTNEWTMHQGIKFESGDERYRWLNGGAGFLIGTFDMDSLEHYYQVYVKGN